MKLSKKNFNLLLVLTGFTLVGLAAGGIIGAAQGASVVLIPTGLYRMITYSRNGGEGEE